MKSTKPMFGVSDSINPNKEDVIKFSAGGIVSLDDLMNEEKAKSILENATRDDDSLRKRKLSEYIQWDKEDDNVILDGEFTAEELKALAWWMENKK